MVKTSLRFISAVFFFFNVVSIPHVVYGDSFYGDVSLVTGKGCREGFNNERTCVKNSKNCPIDYELIDGVCVLVKSKNGLCPSGYIMGEGGRCIKIYENANVICPAGSEMIKDECFKIQEHRPLRSLCPEGSSVMHHGICYLRRKEEAYSVCVDGSLPDKKGCIQVLETQPIIDCPKGYSISIDGGCELILKPNVSCPKDYAMVSNNSEKRCQKRSEVSAVSSCMEGFQRSEDSSGKCVKKSYSFAMEYCEDGFKFIDGKCLKTVEEDAKLICNGSNDLIVYNRECVKVKNVEILCPDGRYTTTGLCDEYEEVDPLRSCKDKSLTPSNGECIRRILPVQNNCPSGVREAKTGECEKVMVNHAYCEMGQTGCVSYDIRSSEFVCKRGQLMRFNGIPTNARGARRLMYTMGVEKCSEVIQAVPKLICPKMYRPNLAEAECTKDTVRRATFVCPTGSTLDFSGKKCEKPVVTSPNIKCPPEYEKTNQKCAKRVSQEPQFFCPFNYKLLNGVCLKNLNSVNPMNSVKSINSVNPMNSVKSINSVNPMMNSRSGFTRHGNSLNPTMMMNRRGGASSYDFSQRDFSKM